MADNYELALKRIKQRYESKGVNEQEAQAQASRQVSQAQQGQDLEWYDRVAGVGINALSNVGQGALKGIEGLVDAGASLVANIGSWFGADTSGIEDFVKYDITNKVVESDVFNNILSVNALLPALVKGENFADYTRKIRDNSYIEELPDTPKNIVQGVEQSIGGMLPGMMLGGYGAGQGVTLAEFGTQAMGQTVEQSLNEGRGLGASTAYGIGSGVKEAFTEWLGGKLFDSKVFGILGKETSGTVTKTSMKTFMKDILKEGFGEGMEEVIGDAIDPMIRKFTIERDGDLGSLYLEAFKGMPESFVSGALSGMLMSGTSSVQQVMKTSLSTYKATEQVTEAVGTLEKAIVEIDANDSLTAEQKQEQAKPYLEKIKELANKYKEITDTFVSENVKLDSAKGQSARYMQELSNDLGKITDIDSASFDNVKRNIRDKYGMNVYKDTSENLEKMIEEQGLEKISELAKKDIEGWTDGKGNIYIAEDSKAFKQGVINKYQTIAHEIGHNLSANQKSKLHSTVLDNISKTKDKLFDRAVNGKQVAINKDNWLDNYKKIYANEIKGMDNEKAKAYVTEEFVNDYISQKSTNAKELNELIKADKTNLIKRMFSKKANRDKIIRNIIEKGLKQSAKVNAKYELLALARNIGASQEEIDKLRKELEPVLASKGNEVKKSKENVITDSEGRKLSKEQQEYFKNSKVVDENGNLLVVYHGTTNAGFTVFEPSKNENYKFGDNTAIFFTNSETMAKSYGNGGTKRAVYNWSKKTISLNDLKTKINEYFKDFPNPRYKNIEIKQKSNGYYYEITYNDGQGKRSFGSYGEGNYYGEYEDENGKKIKEFVPVEEFEDLNSLADNLGNVIGRELIYDSNEEFFNDTAGNIYECYLNIEKPFVVDVNFAWNLIPNPFNKNNDGSDLVDTNFIVKKVLEIGKNDGVIFNNIIDYGTALSEYEEEFISSNSNEARANVYVAFNSSQVKATDNKNPTDNQDILKSKSNAVDEATVDKFSKDVIDKIDTTDEAVNKIQEIANEFNTKSIDDLNTDLINLYFITRDTLIKDISKNDLAIELQKHAKDVYDLLIARKTLRNKFKSDTTFVKEFRKLGLDNPTYKEHLSDIETMLNVANDLVNNIESNVENFKKLHLLEKRYSRLVNDKNITDTTNLYDMLYVNPFKYTYEQVESEFNKYSDIVEERSNPIKEVKQKFLTRLDNLLDSYPNLNIVDNKEINDFVELMKSKINELSYSMEKFDDKTKKIDEAYQTLGNMLDNSQEKFDSQLKKQAKKENTTAVQIVNAKGELTTVNLNDNEDETLKKTYAKILGTDNETKKEINETIGIRNEAEKELNNAVDNLNEINDKLDEATTKAEEKKLKAEKEKAIKQAQIAQKNKISVATKLVRTSIKKFKEQYAKCYEYIDRMDNATIKRDILGNKETGGNKKGLYNSAKDVLEKLNGLYAIINTETDDIKEAVNYFDFEDDTKEIHDTTYDDLAREFNDWFLSQGVNLPQEIEDARLRNIERIELGKTKRSSKKAQDIADGLLALEYTEPTTTTDKSETVEEEPKVIVKEKKTKPRKASKTKVVKTIEGMRKMVKRDSAKLVDEWTNARKDKVTRLKTVNDAIDIIETTLNNIKGNTFRFLFVNGTNGENGRELVADTIHKIVNGYGAYKNIAQDKKVDVISQILIDNAQNMFFNDNADITYQNVNDIPDTFDIKKEIVDCIRETVDTMINEKYEVTDSAIRLQKLTEKYRKSLDKMIKQYDELNNEYIALNTQIKELKQEIKNSNSKVDKLALNNLVDKMVAKQFKEYKTKATSVEQVKSMRDTINTLRDNLRSTSKDKNKILNQNIVMYNDLYGSKRITAFRGRVQNEIKTLTGEKYQLRDDLYSEIAVQLGKGNIEEASKLLIDDITTEPLEVNIIDLETGDVILDDEGNPKKEMVQVRFKEFSGTEEYDTLVQIVNDMFKSIYEGGTVSYKARMEQAIKDLRAKVSEITQMNRVIDGIKTQANTIKDMSKNKGKGLKGGIAKSVQIIANTFSKIARNSVLNGKFRRVISAFYKNYTYKGVNDIAVFIEDNSFSVKNAEGLEIAKSTALEFDDKGKITKLTLENGVKATIDNDKIILNKNGSTIAVLEGIETSKHKNADGTKSYTLDGFDVSYTNKGDSVMDILDYPLNSELEDMIKQVVNMTGKVSVDEVRMYRDIVSGIKKYIKKAGGLHKAKFGEISGTVKEISAEAIRFQNSRKKGRHLLARFVKYVTDPRVFLNHLGKWDKNSFWSNAYVELQKSQSNYEKNYLKLVNKFIEFRKENKQFYNSLKTKKMEINGVEGTIGQFLSIYKLIQQEHSYGHLINQTGGLRVNDKEFKFTEESINDLKTKIENEFDLNNKESVGSKYLELVGEFFKKSGTLKRDTDMILYGFTNVLDINYFPIAISQAEFNKNLSSLNLGDIVFLGSLDYSWNKNRTGKSGVINVLSIDDIIDLHSKQVCTYNAYAEVINDLNYVYNVKQSNVDGFDTGMSLSKTMYNIYGAKNGKGIVDDFLNRLLMNIQGVSTSSGRDKTLTGAVEKLRGNFATAKLGLNLKVMVTQLASIPTALKYVNIFRGFTTFRGVPEAPALAKYRAMNRDIVKSHTLTEKASKLMNWTTACINFCDKLAINWIWRSCVSQCGAVGAEVGSEAYNKAEELFIKTVRETQPNYSPLDRSEMLRSENELVKIFTQFTTVSNKNFSNFVEAIDRWVSGEHSKSNASMIGKTAGALFMTFMTYTIMCQLFKFFIDDDEEKDSLWDYIFSGDFISSYINDNLVGMIPFANKISIDIENKVKGGNLFNSYEYSLGFLDTLNDLQDSMTNLMNGNVSAVFTQKNIAKVFEGTFGIPLTNLNKFFVNMPATNLARMGKPEFKTWLDTYINGKSYNQSDIAKTKNKGLSKSKFDTYVDDKLELSTKSKELLYKVFKTNSNKIDITKVPSTLTDVYGNTIVTDTAKFKKSYSKVSNVLGVFNDSTKFNRLDDTKQAWVVNKALSTYYSTAKKEQTGEELTKLELLTTTKYNIANMLIHLSYITGMQSTSDSTKKDKVAQYIKTTRLTLEEQYILSRLAGYKIPEKYLNRVKSFLRKKGLSKAQIEQFLA